MAEHNTPSGFLSRWSQRKANVREGRAVDEPAAASSVVSAPPAATTAPQNASVSAQALASPPASASTDAPSPLPTLDDVQQLTPESNFAAFMSRKVAPEVKNAAMKKLFSDPHFNVMDGLDIYIDDYSQPDPLPAGMLQQMTSIDGLNLFGDKHKNNDQTEDQTEDKAEEKANDPRSNPDSPSHTPTTLSQPSDNLSTTQPNTTAHDHADLRLQPNPAARPQGAEPKPE